MVKNGRRMLPGSFRYSIFGDVLHRTKPGHEKRPLLDLDLDSVMSTSDVASFGEKMLHALMQEQPRSTRKHRVCKGK